MTRVLMISNEVVGKHMAGPGARYVELARALSETDEVTLAVPNEPDRAPDGPRMVRWDPRQSGLVEVARGYDAVVAQQLPVAMMRALARSEINVIYDLYVPFVTEGLAQRGHWQEDSRAASRNYRTAKAAYEIALLCGNRFICASERQRDLWLGVLSELGRVDADAFRADPSLRQLIDVVPFGLSSGAPGGSSSVLKGVVPGISATDRVLLWGGGVWNWLDPLTVIRAVHRISQARNDVKLYFLGLRHPNPEQPETAMAARAVALARELGVENRFVFFNFGWTPYEERERYLVEADLGVSGHFDTVETRFAFRTRLLDYFWAGLPVVTTRGDELGDVVEREGLGRAIEAEDVAGWVEAILELLDDGVAYDRCRAALDAVRRWYEWQTVARPLSRLCAIPGEPVPSGARSWRLSAEHAALTLRGSLADRGVRETLQEMSARITGGG